ncbi:phosphonate ABC transporter, permease protein PhnE [Cereibacter sp. SYSU M97828]|nr:phosphonate ABC transporter, permease protein PhnE [Cereibacter flavus]
MAVTDLAPIHRGFAKKRFKAFAIPAGILLYLTYAFFAFDIPGLAQRFRSDNAMIMISGAWSYKTHVTQDNRRGTTVAIEGERRATYEDDDWPEWVARDGASTAIALPRDQSVRFDPDAVRVTVPDYGTITVTNTDGVEVQTPDGTLPAWITASNTRADIRLDGGRVSVTRARSEVFRYFPGWELFFFTLSSPFHDMSWGQIAASAVSSEQIRPGMSNIAAMASDFWNNDMWRHKDVVWALFETLLMAFLGTIGAALISFPLAFLAARNFMPVAPARFGIRRVFDFVRGVDALIWTIILSRAFGPGPMTGALAILITDTGSFGKLFSESLENIDEKQVDGLRSTGANALQRGRFGVIPQVAPVILSQVLYFLESNTRGATVIGAMVGGGIGLLLTQAIQTQKDWENVAYYIVLIVLLVMAMDSLSGWLRRKLIRGDS